MRRIDVGTLEVTEIEERSSNVGTSGYQDEMIHTEIAEGEGDLRGCTVHTRTKHREASTWEDAGSVNSECLFAEIDARAAGSCLAPTTTTRTTRSGAEICAQSCHVSSFDVKSRRGSNISLFASAADVLPMFTADSVGVLSTNSIDVLIL